MASKRQKSVSHSLGGCSLRSDASRVRVWQGPASWLTGGTFCCAPTCWEVQTGSRVSFLRPLSPVIRAAPPGPIAFQGPASWPHLCLGARQAPYFFLHPKEMCIFQVTVSSALLCRRLGSGLLADVGLTCLHIFGPRGDAS